MKTTDLILFAAVAAVAFVAVGAIKRAGTSKGKSGDAAASGTADNAYSGPFLDLYFQPVKNPAPGTSQAYNQPISLFP